MKTSSVPRCLAALSFFTTIHHVLAISIAEINGNKFVTPYKNQAVSNVTGLITAKLSDGSGFWIRSLTPDSSSETSESLYIYDQGATTANLTAVGDVITVSGTISSYRSSSAYIPLTELTKPNVSVQSSGNEVKALVIGTDTGLPPTELYSSLDNGNVFGLPNNASQISVASPELQPDKYGLDFWQSIMGELVTIQSPRAVSKPNQYGDTWVVGSWPATGKNARGGLTITSGANGNPEAIIIGDPLDGSSNPHGTKLGDSLEDITGVVYQVFGAYTILPTTALKVSSSQTPALPTPLGFQSTSKCGSILVGDYNIENFAPNSTNLDGRAEHIYTYLGLPDLVFLQEIQDQDGPTDDGVVTANGTLAVLVDAVAKLGGERYSYIDIDPANDQDGGQPGGNIRQAYLYKSSVLGLANANPGGTTDATEVLAGPQLSYNPGRIVPNSTAWKSSRKPLAAQWKVLADNSTFFTVNVQYTAKLGGTSIEGDPRTPVNGGVDQRTQQATITADFVAQILAIDSNAAIIVAGDFNEFTYVQPLQTFLTKSGLVDLDVAAGIDPVERYTYLFEMNSQELDHFFVSNSVAGQQPRLEHVHVNTWVSYADQISDHDPSVALLNVCGGSSSSNTTTATSISSKTTLITSTTRSASQTSTKHSTSTTKSSHTKSSSKTSSRRTAYATTSAAPS